MKKLFLIMIAALCIVAAGCKKTCNCTQTVTTSYDEILEMEPTVSTSDLNKEAKKCSDLNTESTINFAYMHVKTVVECK